jgi:hypothetical protein
MPACLQPSYPPGPLSEPERGRRNAGVLAAILSPWPPFRAGKGESELLGHRQADLQFVDCVVDVADGVGLVSVIVIRGFDL